ncbi:MAG TPA: hypothetical protein VKT82_35055 [Ktedonobacterales bacterium]|nr:hypothetical protein [Ktedonobacterales bacterium]
MFGLHFVDLAIILLLLLLWVLPGLIVFRDAARRPPAGRQLGRTCALFGLPGALVYFGLLRVHYRLQATKQQRLRGQHD